MSAGDTAARHGSGAAPHIAVVIPCLNEARTIAKVVRDFRATLPDADIVVFDNASTDRTAELAHEAGARVVSSPRRGKGNVIRHAVRVIEADLWILADGDDTYDASAAPALLRALRDGHADMVVATRLEQPAAGAFRLFHQLGNRWIASIISSLFRTRVTDVLSGYRVISRELMSVFEPRGGGFEVETELTLQALAKGFEIVETPVGYAARPPGSESKLDTWSDGLLILRCIFLLFKDYQPFLFFSVISALLVLASLASGSAPIADFVRTGYVLHVPRAVLAASLAVLAALSFAVGTILDTIARYHAENIALWRRRLRERR